MVVSPVVNERFTVTVESLGAGGEGVARLPDGRVVFVHLTAPEERCEIELTAVKKRWARGRLIRVLDPGPERRKPPCPFFGECGGCTLEHLTYAGQLKSKRRTVRDALERIGGRTGFPDVEIHPSPMEFHYRNRVSFTLRRRGTKAERGPQQSGPEAWGTGQDDGGGVIAGFHHLEDPDRIVDVDGRCLLPEEPIARAWDQLRASWGPGADRLPSGAELRLTLRTLADGELLLLVEGGTPEDAERERVRDLLDEVEALHAIWHRPDPEARPDLLAGSDDLEELWYGERYPVRPGGFLQVNREGARLLHDLVLRELGAPRGRRVVDAYCGVGVYGRRAARHGAEALGIERDPQAVTMARSRPVDGFSVVEGRVEEHLPESLPADLVILNPPRAGVDDRVTRALATSPPARIVYVSCDPATLARDVARLGDAFRIVRVQAVDLFPQTAHVEVILTLDHSGGDGS